MNTTIHSQFSGHPVFCVFTRAVHLTCALDDILPSFALVTGVQCFNVKLTKMYMCGLTQGYCFIDAPNVSHCKSKTKFTCENGVKFKSRELNCVHCRMIFGVDETMFYVRSSCNAEIPADLKKSHEYVVRSHVLYMCTF